MNGAKRANYLFTVAQQDSPGKSKELRVEISRADSGTIECRVDGKSVPIDAQAVQPNVVSMLLDGSSYEAHRTGNAESSEITIAGETFTVTVRDPRSLRARRGAGAASDGPKKITAPMPGKVVRVLAPEGTAVEAGQGVIVIEAMKMQNELKSPKAGVVKKINSAEGATVNAGDTLAVIE